MAISRSMRKLVDELYLEDMPQVTLRHNEVMIELKPFPALFSPPFLVGCYVQY